MTFHQLTDPEECALSRRPTEWLTYCAQKWIHHMADKTDDEKRSVWNKLPPQLKDEIANIKRAERVQQLAGDLDAL